MKHYESLGVSKDASSDDIRKAYRKLAIQHHPDKGGDQDKFKEISAAYEVLSDQEKRNQYDQFGDNGPPQMGGHPFGDGGINPHDIFAQMFGGGGGMPGFHFNMHQQHQQQNITRNDINHEINISLADAFNGLSKTIKINLKKNCLSCKSTCNDCQGRGMVQAIHRMGIFTQMTTSPCGRCNGSGKMSNVRPDCKECNGKGSYNEDHKQDIVIPKAVSHHHKICINGLGEQKQSREETSGNLILIICINSDNNFVREGNNLIYKSKISFIESVIGKDITIPYFGGDITLNISKYGIIKPNNQYIIEGKGMTEKDKMILIFEIEYPSNSFDESEKQILIDAFAKVKLS
jgi:DnaJ-class molecular chaperone